MIIEESFHVIDNEQKTTADDSSPLDAPIELRSNGDAPGPPAGHADAVVESASTAPAAESSDELREAASDDTRPANRDISSDDPAVASTEPALSETIEAQGATNQDESADVPVDMDVAPLEETPEADERPEDVEKQWFILKVQSNRENSICDALRRQIAIRGLDDYFGEILIPTEDVAEFKNGKRRVVKRKLYPGYIVVRMALTDETWFVVRETPGIGDFTGAAGKPSPMLPEEIEPILRTMFPPEEGTESVKTSIPFKLGDRVRIKDGTFENFEGDVETIDEANGRVTVIINIFGRSTPVELEHWQIESV